MDPEHAADLLARERARVENSLDSLLSETAENGTVGGEMEPEDRAASLTQFETDSALAERLRRELVLINEAEGRLRDGTYGISVVSGDEIPDERLEALPWADRKADEL